MACAAVQVVELPGELGLGQVVPGKVLLLGVLLVCLLGLGQQLWWPLVVLLVGLLVVPQEAGVVPELPEGLETVQVSKLSLEHGLLRIIVVIQLPHNKRFH